MMKTPILIVLFLFFYTCAFATDGYGLVIDDDSNVALMTLNKSSIAYNTDCNPDADFSYYDGVTDSSDSSEIYFELDGVHGDSSSCTDTFKTLINYYGATTCNFGYNGSEETCDDGDYDDDYSGVVVFSGTIYGANDYKDNMYNWVQICAIKDDALQQADCYISYNSASGNIQPPLLFQGNNGSMFYICVGQCSSALTEAQYNEAMKVLNDIKMGLNVAKIILSLLLL
ncbi:hypothetical protein [Cysteiniphilum sp. JM-1]|uniref:hypothetical protein n=1 Tax=Cysteiniphilum sp. JM-1 TaxID=2610891 RepID=UPI0012463E76|nr:hypothetical protein [Cysteiniphilum sp. JM-1]